MSLPAPKLPRWRLCCFSTSDLSTQQRPFPSALAASPPLPLPPPGSSPPRRPLSVTLCPPAAWRAGPGSFSADLRPHPTSSAGSALHLYVPLSVPFLPSSPPTSQLREVQDGGSGPTAGGRAAPRCSPGAFPKLWIQKSRALSRGRRKDSGHKVFMEIRLFCSAVFSHSTGTADPLGYPGGSPCLMLTCFTPQQEGAPLLS